MKWGVLVGCGLGLVAAAGVAAVGGRTGDDGRVSISDPLGTGRADELTVEIRAAAERARVKSEVTAALVRGEMSIEDAAAAFHKVLAADPAVMARLRMDWPKASDRELVLRNLAAFVRWHHRADPERVPAVLARVAREIGRAAGPHANVVTVQ